jgi:hypothetical protein
MHTKYKPITSNSSPDFHPPTPFESMKYEHHVRYHNLSMLKFQRSNSKIKGERRGEKNSEECTLVTMLQYGN